MNNLDSLPAYLTDDQRRAVLHSGGPLLIIAGPGSGKTEVVSWRVAHLVRSGQVTPDHLLVTTFTNKAALELKDRIQRKLPEVNVELVQVSTIHSFCADLLRRYRRRSPLPHGFRILDGDGQFLFVYANRKRLGLDSLVKGRPHELFESVVRTFNLATEELVDPVQFEKWCHDNCEQCSSDERELWQERLVVAEAYRRYCGLLQEQELVDFAFLQRHVVDLLAAHRDVLEELRQQYQHILVDEYQDTNAAQDRILESLAGDGMHLTVVGDDDQSIYRFRGATVRNIRTFMQRFPGATEIVLRHNFRSQEPIVEHSLRVIDHNPARYYKPLISTRQRQSDILLVYEHSAQDEAHTIARLLYQLHQEGKISRYGDVALLLRSVRSYAEPYLEAFRSFAIPYYITGDASFFERDEIRQLYDLFSFLSASKPWGDRFLRHPLVGLSQSTCQALEAYKGDLMDILTDQQWETIGVVHEGDRQRLRALLELKRQVQSSQHTSLLEVFYRLLSIIQCVARFESSGNSEALANLGIMSRIVATWDEFGSSNNFYPFHEYLKLLKEGGIEPFREPPEDAVQIMTIHQAKGLEFPVVVLGAAMQGRLPSTPRKDRYEVPYHMRASGMPEVDDPHLVDERKLFYVAVTRARDLLIIGTADVVNKRGGGPSQFLTEMFGDDLRAVADVSRARIAAAESQGERAGEPRPRYSFSDLAYYLQCPMRYKFTSVYGFEPLRQDPVNFGANVHRALEMIHQRALAGHPTQEEDIETIVAETWLSPRGTDPDEEREYQRAAIAQLRRYVRDYASSLGTITQCETSFAFALGERVLTGKIDLLRNQGRSGQEVIDFKTSRMVMAEKEGIDLQLDLYALGVESGFGLEVSHQTAHFLQDGSVYSKEWTAAGRADAQARLEQVLGQIEQKHFLPRIGYCTHCEEFRAICPYSPEQIMEDMG